MFKFNRSKVTQIIYIDFIFLRIFQLFAYFCGRELSSSSFFMGLVESPMLWGIGLLFLEFIA